MMRFLQRFILICLLITISSHIVVSAEELVVKDNKVVMFRESKESKDYFFTLDKIIYIEKDLKSIENRYKIGLTGGKIISMYDINNYRRLMSAYLETKNPKKQNNDKKIKYYKKQSYSSKNNSIKDVNYTNTTPKEEEVIKDMNIGSTEKIIALDPMDIKEVINNK